MSNPCTRPLVSFGVSGPYEVACGFGIMVLDLVMACTGRTWCGVMGVGFVRIGWVGGPEAKRVCS